jgi:hypothetical protein
MATHAAFAKRKFGVCGGRSKLSNDAARFCEAVGASVMQRANLVLVSCGAKGSATAGGTRGADWHFVDGARKALLALGASEHERIETVVLGVGDDGEHFSAGRTFNAPGRTRESRRFAFVRRLDMLLAVGGGKGTRQNLRLADALDLPVLPVPLFGGTAEEHWTDLREAGACAEFFAAAERMLSQRPVERVAGALVDLIAARLRGRCFVISAFNDEPANLLYEHCIRPALEQVGDDAVRLDRMRVPGNASTQIDDGIANCDYVIAVLDGFRPNVLYEIGLAHGYGKPAFLLKKRGAPSDNVPFDLVTQQRLEYEDPREPALRTNLAAAIRTLKQRV